MTARVLGICWMVIATAMLGAHALDAQEPAAGEDFPAGAGAEVDAADPTTELNGAAPPASPMPGLAGEPIALTNAQLTRRLLELEIQTRALGENLSDTAGKVLDLKQEVDALSSQINDEIEKQRQILDAISSQDSQGRRIPRLSAIMKESPEFKEEMTAAVNDALLPTGAFEIENRTATYQRIYVNRTEYGVDPGKVLRLSLPVGTVTTQLPGKPLENWTLAAPTNSQRIEIVPEADPMTTYRPIYSAPAYVYPPYYWIP